jgi:redox-sensing transcriptional repressor
MKFGLTRIRTVSEEIPDIVIGRLPVYLRALTNMAETGHKLTTSSHELGERLGISSAQIRKDLSHFGEFGKQGTGYHINYLVDQLRQILHLDREWPVALVGAGHIGHALASYNGFQHRGFRIAWIFDNDAGKIGTTVGGLTIQAIDEMVPTLKREKAQVAVLAVPASVAQEIANKIAQTYIRAILNYAPVHLNVPPHIHVRHNDPVIQMQRMTFYLDTDLA